MYNNNNNNNNNNNTKIGIVIVIVIIILIILVLIIIILIILFTWLYGMCQNAGTAKGCLILLLFVSFVNLPEREPSTEAHTSHFAGLVDLASLRFPYVGFSKETLGSSVHDLTSA